jgi:hypothetical protein
MVSLLDGQVNGVLLQQRYQFSEIYCVSLMRVISHVVVHNFFFPPGVDSVLHSSSSGDRRSFGRYFEKILFPRQKLSERLSNVQQKSLR